MDVDGLEKVIKLMAETGTWGHVTKSFAALSAVICLLYKDTRSLFVTVVKAAWNCARDPYLEWKHKDTLRKAAERCTAQMLANANYAPYLSFFAKQALARIERRFRVYTLDGALEPILVTFQEERLLSMRASDNFTTYIVFEDHDVLRAHVRALVKNGTMKLEPDELVPSGPDQWASG